MKVIPAAVMLGVTLLEGGCRVPPPPSSARIRSCASARIRSRAQREQHRQFQEHLHASQAQNLALTLMYVPYSLYSNDMILAAVMLGVTLLEGGCRVRARPQEKREQHRQFTWFRV